MSHSSVFPLEIQELRRPGSTYKVDVRWFTSVKDIKDQLQKETKCPASRMQLYHSVGSKGLPNKTTLHDLGITQPGGLLFLAFVYSSNPQFMLLPAKDVSVDEQCEEMMDEVRIGLRSGHLPAKTDMLDCTGGVYFMKGSANTPAAVFKPSDEEQGMPNNPKGYAGNGDYGLRPFFRPGEGCLREMASYILDHDHFCGVPPTLLVHCEHDSFHYPRNSTGQKTMFPKLGSLQRFIPSGDTFEDIGHSLVGVLELQKIALLDMRLLNCDRNASNMLAIRKSPAARAAARVNGAPRKYSRSSSLASEGGSNCGGDEEISMEDFLDAEPQPQVSRYSDSYSLVPIDHGYCLPSHLRIDELDWAWFHCPHVAVEVQPEIRDYVNSLDIDALLQELTRQVAVPEDCLFLLRVAHAVIKEGIAAGLTLRDIAAIIARTDEDVPSPLENAIAAAEENALRAIEMRAGRRNTTSPSFLKSLQEASGGAVTPAGINLTELVVGVGGFSGKGGDSVLGSPAPVIVKQKSVGSPRSGGTASPPQRIGAVKRVSPPSPAMSPNEGEESDGYSINSTTGGSYQTKSTVQGAAVLKKTRSRSSDFDAEGELSDGSSFASPQARKPLYSGGAVPSAVVRPFPLRNTPPERQRRVVSSELNLEAIGLAAASPPPAVAGGPPSASSLSSNSRSPIPPRSEKGLPVPARSATGAGAGETATIAYLSSENIQKLQSSPAMSASKLLFRDSLRALSGLPPPGLITPAGEATGRSGSPSNNELGDYFMKDLTLPPPASAPAGIAGTASEGLRLDPPPMFLCSSNSAASSPHHSRSNSAFTLLQPGMGSKDRIVATESGERLAATTINKPSSGTGLAHAYGSAQSVGSSGSGGSGGGAARPRPGDPLFTLQSFDEDYVRNRQRAAALSLAAQGVAVVGVDKATGAVSPAVPPQPPLLSLLPVVAGEGKSAAALAQTAQWPTAAVSPAQESRRPGSSAATEGQTAISASLFASDSDFTAHTSYESSWASESPKASPKVPFKERKTFPALEESAEEEGSGSSKKGTSERKINNINNAKVQVPVRDDARSSWRVADSAEHAAGSLCDGPVHLVIPLKGEQDCGAGPAGDSSGRECSSSVELGGTDTEGDAEELGPQSQQRTHTMVHSAVKEPPNRALVSPDPGRATSWSLAPKLSRVASFAAFESPPLYDLPKTERQLTRLRQEKRKINATTAEYQQLRLTFAREMISALITKTSRSKAHL